MADLDVGLAALREAAAGNVPMVDLTPDEARDRVVAGNRLCSAGPDVVVADLSAGAPGPPVPVRIYEGGRADATLLYAHGGGWVTGDLDYSDELCRFLAAGAGVRVVSIDYRLAPEHPFPTGLEDLAASWAWAVETYDGPHGVGGDSAGGNLAAALTHRLVRSGGTAPAFQLLIYPVLGLPDRTASYRTQEEAFPIGAADMRWFFDHYLTGVDVTEPTPDLAPLHAPDVSALPPTHLVVAGFDPLHDEAVEFGTALAAAGVPVTVADHADLCHGFLRFTAASAAAREARSAIVEAVAQLAAGPKLPFHTGRRIAAYDSPNAPRRTPARRAGENRGSR